MKKKSNLPVSTSKKTTALSLRKQAMIGFIAMSTLTVATISSSRLLKLEFESIKILMEDKLPVCEQYALTASQPDYYPCFECKNGKIFLKEGEVWRYGFAGIGGEASRYPSNVYYKDENWKLTNDELEYRPQLRSTRAKCLLAEKMQIYSYPMLPEAQARNINLIRPPGNKQDR